MLNICQLLSTLICKTLRIVNSEILVTSCMSRLSVFQKSRKITMKKWFAHILQNSIGRTNAGLTIFTKHVEKEHFLNLKNKMKLIF